MADFDDIERRLGGYTIVPEAEYVPVKTRDLQDAMWEIILLRKRSDHAQAVIDRLMWEFCPDEMTEEQISNWEKNQVEAGPEDVEALKAALEDCTTILVEDEDGDEEK